MEQALNRAQSEAPTLATVNTVAALQTELQNSMVNKALGQDVGKELERLEKVIVKAETSDAMANAEALAAQTRHGATLAAIEAKLTTERNNLADLEADAQVMKAALLTDKAQAIGAEYAQVAQKTLSALLKLMALDAELTKITNKASGQLPQASWNVALPKTPGMTAHTPYSGQHFVDSERVGLDISQAGSALKAELTKEGYRL